MSERVLVLGGGLAGVACALELGDAGVAVTLVDRNDSPTGGCCGGRIW